MADNPEGPVLKLQATVDTSEAEKGVQGITELLQASLRQNEEQIKAMKELAKSVGDIVGVSGTAAKDNADITKKAKEDVVQSVEEIRQSIDKAYGQILSTHENFGMANFEQLDKIQKEVKDRQDKLIREFKTIDTTKLRGDSVKAYKDKWKELDETLKQVEKTKQRIAMATSLKRAKGVAAHELGGIAKLGDLAGATQGIMGSLAHHIPGGLMGGGLIGLVLAGIGSAEAIRSGTSELLHHIETNIGHLGDKVGTNMVTLGNLINTTARSIGVSREELGGVFNTLSKGGLTVERMGLTFDKLDDKWTSFTDAFNGSAEVMYQNLGVLTVAIDRAFAQAAGTTAKEAVAISQQMGLSVEHAVTQYARLKMAAQDAAIGSDSYTNSVMQAARGLSQLGVDISTTSQLFDILLKQQGAFGGDASAGGILRAQKALQGISAAIGKLAGNDGLASFMGEKLAQMEGGSIGGIQARDPIEARRALLLGLGQTDDPNRQRVLGDMIQVMQQMARQAGGGNAARQEMFLEKTFGMDVVTANLLNSMSAEDIKNLREGRKPEKLTEEEMKKIQHGMEAARGADSFKERMERALNGLMELVRGLLGFVMAIAGMVAKLAGFDIKMDVGQMFTQSTKSMVTGTSAVFGELGGAIATLAKGYGLEFKDDHGDHAKQRNIAESLSSSNTGKRLPMTPAEKTAEAHKHEIHASPMRYDGNTYKANITIELPPSEIDKQMMQKYIKEGQRGNR